MVACFVIIAGDEPDRIIPKNIFSGCGGVVKIEPP
jgi:hypothetical protein